MEIKSKFGPSSTIPTASMADIAFLLIVFFILTFNLAVDTTQPILPDSMVRSEIPKKSAYVSVDQDGIIRFSSGEDMSQPCSAEEVMSHALVVLASNPEKIFVIKAHNDTPYKIIDEVIDYLGQAHAKNIFLLTEQEVIEGGS